MWEPIETAPEGKQVLVAVATAGAYVVRQGLRLGEKWVVLGMIEHDPPQFWHPQPEPPPMGLKTKARIEIERRSPAERE